jgi:hypothetical protein
MIVAKLSPLVDFPFGLDRRSLVWVEGFLERQRDEPGIDAETLVPTLGSFLGQCLVEGGGGRWVEREEGWCVHCPRTTRSLSPRSPRRPATASLPASPS